MSDERNIQAPANLKAVLHELQGMEEIVLATARQSVDRTNQEVIGYIVQEKLSVRGPKTLGRVTSRLARSVNATPARISGGTVQTSIGTDVEYAAAHEFGYNEAVTVRKHTRKQAAFVFGKFNPKAGEPVTVRSHKRKMKLPARRMIQAGLDETDTDYMNNLREDLEAVLRR